MKLRTMAVFGVGYVLGTRAGRERYEQIAELVERARHRLEARLEPSAGEVVDERDRASA